jgi:hypothetical protein
MCIQDDPKFKQAMRTKNAEARLRAFVALCGSKRFDEETGAPQPAYKLDGPLRIMAEFPRPKVTFLRLRYSSYACLCLNLRVFASPVQGCGVL